MKTAIDFDLQPGSLSLKYYKFYTPGFRVYRTKSKIIEALNLGIIVYRLDKIMNEVHLWNNKTEKWENVK